MGWQMHRKAQRIRGGTPMAPRSWRDVAAGCFPFGPGRESRQANCVPQGQRAKVQCDIVRRSELASGAVHSLASSLDPVLIR
jgi:hypothetical protein